MKNQFRRMPAGILAMLMVISSPMSSFAEVNVASSSEATTAFLINRCIKKFLPHIAKTLFLAKFML